MTMVDIYCEEEPVVTGVAINDALTVGRHPDNDLVLDDLTLSRFHLRFERRGARYAVVDLGGHNGVFQNGTRIDGEELLSTGDELLVGRYVILFHLGEESERTRPLQDGDSEELVAEQSEGEGAQATARIAPAPSLSADLDDGDQKTEDNIEVSEVKPKLDDPLANATFLLLFQGEEVSRHPCRDGMVIGRAKSCDVTISLLGLSRRHAEIFRKDDVYHVKDLGSQNGTWLNHDRIDGSEPLKDGDLLNYYEYTLVFLKNPPLDASEEADTSVAAAPEDLLDPADGIAELLEGEPSDEDAVQSDEEKAVDVADEAKKFDRLAITGLETPDLSLALPSELDVPSAPEKRDLERFDSDEGLNDLSGLDDLDDLDGLDEDVGEEDVAPPDPPRRDEAGATDPLDEELKALAADLEDLPNIDDLPSLSEIEPLSDAPVKSSTVFPKSTEAPTAFSAEAALDGVDDLFDDVSAADLAAVGLLSDENESLEPSAAQAEVSAEPVSPDPKLGLTDKEMRMILRRKPGAIEGAEIEVCRDGERIAKYAVESNVVRVGTDDRCEVILKGVSGVFPWHLTLIGFETMFLCQAARPNAHIYLDGSLVSYAIVRDGDEIEVGSIVLRFNQT